ncbi:cystathione beta-lyase [Allopseudospirillum japonicum]|uniref:cysteine-S-conjugate beta-lyase n=1 Tax=Allopseudospirillum japonicum TaxID=64971 RepID=A0A1H6THE6_9GAMM|nr:PatB family C-S lyase [Allopseudospirillum japonicum]SEI79503.1 cystathione beta-lyase [Allopseudospirillum japonicum]
MSHTHISSGQGFDFDSVYPRRASASLKWNRYPKEVLPLWVADMDFRAAPSILEALHTRVDQGILGYTQVENELNEAFCAWAHKRYQADFMPESLVWIPGVVSGFHLATQTCTQAGEAILIQPPIYPPILALGGLSGRQTQSAPLVYDPQQGWQFDWQALEDGARAGAKLLIFCHPHNPTGRVFTTKELQQLGDFCAHWGIKICSDEIHCDLILDETRTHRPFASLHPYVADHSITLMAPSKTFNIAGLACSVAIIPNPELRRAFKRQMQGLISDVNVLGLTAAKAAYQTGEPWLEAALTYLRGNRDYLATWMEQHPQLQWHCPEATFLAWIDFARLWPQGYPHEDVVAQGIALSAGVDFGAPTWARLNFGCPRALLAQALQSLDAILPR